MKKTSLHGDTYGLLTVVNEGPPAENSQRHRRVWCKCRCGNSLLVLCASLSAGRTHSCGCLRRDVITRHGKSEDPAYNVYIGMIARCHKPQSPNFGNYGAKGISVCDEWRGELGLRVFMEWAHSHGYKKGLQIDRVNNSGGYSPENCRFVTAEVNTNNRECTVRTPSGKPLADCWRAGHHPSVSYLLALARFTRLAWTIEDSLFRPVAPKKHRAMMAMAIALLCITCSAQPPGVLTKSYSNDRSGMNPHETVLTQDAIAKHGLVLSGTIPVYGDARGMEAQPLIAPVAPGLQVPCDPTTKATSTPLNHCMATSVMVLPSMANIIRGVDPVTGVGFWQTPQLCVPVNSTPQNDMWRVNDHFGMMSTGVIDADTGKLYVVATCSKDGTGSQASMSQTMYVLDVRTGAILATTALSGCSNGICYQDAPRKQRGALALWKQNGVKFVMIEAGSFNEYDRSAGWLLAFDTYDNQVKAAFAPHAGLWQSGLGPVIDDAKGLIYVGAGNGPFDHVTSFGEAAMQIQFTPPTAVYANRSGADVLMGSRPASFTVLHAWAPFSDSGRTCANPQLTTAKSLGNRLTGAAMPAMNAPCDNTWSDQDAWLTGTLLVKQHMYLGAGKDGIAYALSTDHFPDTQPADFANPKANCAKATIFEAGWDLGVDPCPTNAASLNQMWQGKTRHQHSPIVHFEQAGVTYVLFFGENSPLQIWKLSSSTGGFSYVARGTELASAQVPSGMPGGFCTVSTNAGANPIAWCSVPDGDANRTVTTGHLIAYDLRNLAALEGTGKMIPTIAKSKPYSFSKFSAPIVWGGEVVLPNYNGGVMVFGLGK